MTSQPIPPRQVRAADAVRFAAEGYRIIDVREQVEWNDGHIPNATLLPLADLASRVGQEVPDLATPLLLHCAVGARSARAAAYLSGIGYTNIANLAGSLADWRAAGGAWEAPEQLLSPTQQRRYSRQTLIPEIGQAGQRKLLDSKVLLIGAGGLGSPVALYLAASGIGTIGLVDDDVVDESNLQRQVLHTVDRIGQPKTASARVTLEALNPETRVVEHRERLSAENVERLIAGYDVIVDGTDNFDTRYVLNDAAVKLRKPVVHGSIYRWDGQVTTFVPFGGPCYRCMYPTQPPDELAPACAVAGVLGVLPGIAGMLQANEVFKLLLGVGETLAGRLLMFDAMTTEFSEVRIWRDPDCPACGERSPYLVAQTEAQREEVPA
jgi:molybdopterin/thiamine biosynthesis adenylyltransferase/rhodanese-related sulfurtransferase